MVLFSLSAFVVSGLLAVGYSLFQRSDHNETLPKEATRNFAPLHADTKPDFQDSTHVTPQLRYPNIVGATYKHEDYTDLDEEVGMRKFTIPNGTVGTIYLHSVYQSYFSSDLSAELKITRLADSDAAFSDIFQLVLDSTKHWKSIVVHVGEFAQDYCGENIEIIYTLNSVEVSALFFDNSNRDAILKDSQCPLMPQNLPSERWMELSAFCKERASCLRNYFENPSNRNKLQSEFIKLVSDLQIE